MVRRVVTVTVAVVVTLVAVWLASADDGYHTYLPVVARNYDGHGMKIPNPSADSVVVVDVNASHRRSDPGAVLTVSVQYAPYDVWLFTPTATGAYYRVGEITTTATLVCDGNRVVGRQVELSSYDYGNNRGQTWLTTNNDGQVSSWDWVRDFDIGHSRTRFVYATCPDGRRAYATLVTRYD